VKAILANDTSGTSNPGCKGTVHCLVEGAQRHGISIVSRVPVGYGYDVFSSCFKSPPLSIGQRMENRLRRICGAGRTAAVSPSPERIDRSRWREAISVMYERLSPLWTDADLLLVNGEGTIHHDSIGALALIGICAAARRMRKKVALVNCSIFSLDEILVDSLRESVDYFSVREPMTFRYLKSNNIAATQSADCLFLASRLSERPDTPRPVLSAKTPYVVYTPGVLSAFGRINESTVADDIKTIRNMGREVVYYVVEAEDEKFASVAARAGASILPLGATRWEQVQPFLAGAEWVVSGRYHINIFASMSGTPFIPLETNTAKMQGLLELLGRHNSQSIRKWSQTSAVGGAAAPRISPDAAINISSVTIAKCADLAEFSVDFTSRLDLSKKTSFPADNLPEMAEANLKTPR
jgi:polysaccharide pyruvyl transferase WcaK-like protein